MFGGGDGRLVVLEVLGSGKQWELSMCLFLKLAYWFQDSSQYFIVVELYSQSYTNNAKQIKLGVMSSDWKVLVFFYFFCGYFLVWFKL